MERDGVLKGLGLTETESKIFLALLRLGEVTAPEIVKDVGMYKPSVYATLERLEKKGLVSRVAKEHKRLYSAANPKKILDMLEERKADFLSIMPSLLREYESGKPEREISVFVGKDGVKTIFDEIIATDKDYDIIGSSLQAVSLLQHRFIQFLKKFAKGSARLRSINLDTSRVRKGINELTKPFMDIKERWKVKFVSKNYFSPIAVNIYGDIVALMVWEDEPFVVRIRNENVARSFRNYFNLLWRIAKP